MSENANSVQANDSDTLNSSSPVKIQLKRPVCKDLPPAPPPAPRAPINMIPPEHTLSPIAQRTGAGIQKIAPVKEENVPQSSFLPCHSNAQLREDTFCNSDLISFNNMPNEKSISKLYYCWNKTVVTLLAAIGLLLICTLLTAFTNMFDKVLIGLLVIIAVAVLFAFMLSRIMIFRYYYTVNSYARGTGIILPVNFPPLLASLLTVLIPLWEIPFMIALELNYAKCLNRTKKFGTIIFFLITAYIGGPASVFLSWLIASFCHNTDSNLRGFKLFFSGAIPLLYSGILIIAVMAVYAHLYNGTYDILFKYRKLVNKERRISGIADK